MFLITVASVIAGLHSVRGGYQYPKSEVRLELPNINPSIDLRILNEYKNSNENKISYSLPYRDNNYLQQNGDNTQNVQLFNTDTPVHQDIKIIHQTGFVPAVTGLQANDVSAPSHFFVNNPNVDFQPSVGQDHGTLIRQQAPTVINLQSGTSHQINAQNVQHNLHLLPNLINANNIEPQLNLQNAQNILPMNVDNYKPLLNVQYNQLSLYNLKQNNPNLHQNAAISSSSSNVIQSQFFNLQNDFTPQNTYNPINVLSNKPLSNFQNNIPQPQVQNAVSPVVTKHIYFHVPPPEIEEIPATPAPGPAKKTYKIILIKLPNQESRNIADLQAAYNRLGSIEDKTLIYVLVNKKAESSQPVVPPYKPSDHEVLFVKYKEKDDELSQR